MKYYFFQTSQQMRDGVMKPTLRALSGQTFEDGSPVSTELNVSAPKTAKDYSGGTREEYPDGTIFCSSYLSIDTTKSKPFYTVFPNRGLSQNPGATLDFHPVKNSDTFQYIKLEHRDEKMEAAYALFEAGIPDIFADYGQSDEAETKTQPCQEKSVTFTPADENGFARSQIENWQEKYSGQLNEEGMMFGQWMARIFRDKGVTPANRIMMNSELSGLFDSLYKCGENLDSLASRPRFEAYLKEMDITYDAFATLKEGPMQKYLNKIAEEHKSRKTCTATERNLSNANELNDAVSIINNAHNNNALNICNISPEGVNNMRKAFELGWTLNELIEPDNLAKGTDINDYADKLAKGLIALPVKFLANNATFIETLMADRKNAKPKDSEGFHVNEEIWKLLVRNLHRCQNTMITGPSGSGKTELIKLLCKKMGVPCRLIQMGAMTDPTEQLAGKWILDANKIPVFDLADFAIEIQKPGVIILDEINRIPKSGENILYSCLDDTRELSIAGADGSRNRTIKVHPDCCFFATANIGDEYTGTSEIDEAIRNRFMRIELNYMSITDETKILMVKTGISYDDAYNIAMIAAEIRTSKNKSTISNTITTRETQYCAQLVKDGFPCLNAIEMVILPNFDNGFGDTDTTSERSHVKNIISQRFNIKKSK